MHTQSMHFYSPPRAQIQAEMDMAVQSPISEGMEDDPVFVMFVVLRKACSTFWQSSSSKQTLENTQGTYEFSCKMFLERWSAVFISWST